MKICDMKAGQPIIFTKPKQYEFVKSLGAGGTGKTILMQDATINQYFVCKKYDPEQKEYEDEFFSRFVDEIKIMYSLFDRNIVRIFDYYLYPEEKTGYIIMEYIKGCNIDEYFQFNQFEQINSIFVQMINAFAYLEQNNILHRDIRAANIIIDSSGSVKVIDFGFGKCLNAGNNNEQASIILNWPASKIPNEIYKEVYNEGTEIFYVGYLIKNIIDKYSIDCFKYKILLDQMISVNPSERFSSFEIVKQKIAEQTFENISFSDSQKKIYQEFASAICNVLSSINDTLTLEWDTSVIIENLRIILRDNSLEKYISKPEKLIQCFVKSGFKYYRKGILVSDVKLFYDFFVSQTSPYQEIILNNLYGRINNIPIIDSTSDMDLPFN
ncbi:MAG: protein kinase family protein [Eubacteriales bacterium]|nr:protein kinase family protein [Eubacteriales bacterium]